MPKIENIRKALPDCYRKYMNKARFVYGIREELNEKSEIRTQIPRLAGHASRFARVCSNTDIGFSRSFT